MGRVTFSRLNVPLEMVNWEIVTAAELVLVSTRLWFALDPTATLPKFNDDEFGETASVVVALVALFDGVPAPTEPQPEIQAARQTVTTAEQQALQNVRDADLHIALLLKGLAPGLSY